MKKKLEKGQIELKLYARYFKDGRFSDNQNCSIAKAIKEQIKGFKPNVGTTSAWDEYQISPSLKFKEYSENMFKRDRTKASKSVHNKIIRVVAATEV